MRRLFFDTHFPTLAGVFIAFHSETLAELAPGRRSAGQEIGCAVPDQLFKLVEHSRIPPPPGYFLFHRLQCIGDGKGGLVWSLGRQGIVHIDNLQDSGGNRGPHFLRVCLDIRSRRIFRGDDE